VQGTGQVSEGGAQLSDPGTGRGHNSSSEAEAYVILTSLWLRPGLAMKVRL
jgi:hypothetical protein